MMFIFKLVERHRAQDSRANGLLGPAVSELLG